MRSAAAAATFSDIVMDAARRDDLRPDADLALAAVLLDAAGLVFADFTRGVSLVRVHDELLVGPVVRAIRYAAGDEQVRTWSEAVIRPPLAQHIVVFTPSKSSTVAEDALIAARRVGCAIVGVAAAYADLPEALVTLGTGYGLPSINPDAVEDVIMMCTGDEIDATGLGCVSARVVLLAVAPGVKGSDALATIRKLASKRSTGDDDAEPVALGDAAASIVTRLRDLHGYGEAKTWGLRLAADLSAYKKNELTWEDLDRGILLSGPPGCGKTFFARALAAECGVPLIATSYSEWAAHKAGGDSISKAIKAVFERARAAAPCIVFIDEIDSIGFRGGNSHNESFFAPTINGILAELDGAVPRDGIVCIAATNLPERVDSALRRPGRLDRHIVIPRPTIADLKGVIMFALGAGALDDGLDRAARACRGHSPADVAQLAREARRVARMSKRRVSADDLADVLAVSREKRPPDVDRVIAVHEAGHALAAVALGCALDHVDVDACEAVTRFPAGTATRSDVEQQITVTLAGRAANTLIGGQPTGGACGDLEQATSLAVRIIAQQGLVDGLIWVPEDIARLDQRVMKLVASTLEKCDQDAFLLLSVRQRELLALADALVEHRYLDGSEVAEIVRGSADKVYSCQ